MMSIDTLTTFFGWCTIINFGLLLLGWLKWILAKDAVGGLYAWMFGVTIEEFKVTNLHVLIQFKAAILILNLVPYIALKIMA